jgi:hypothetical protein
VCSTPTGSRCDRAIGPHTGVPRGARLWAADEQSYAVNLNYSSHFFRMPHGVIAEKVAVIGPTLQRSTGAGLLAYENDMMILTLIGVDGQPCGYFNF